MTFARLRLAVFIIALAHAAPMVSAQTRPTGRETTAASVARYPLADLMPVDPDATVGTLPNGLRYYVRPNAKPASRAELRLVVNAGSMLEDDDQRGLAHFVEHMNFEGTKHFPGQGIANFLSTLGLSIGADANAATSYDDTQYTLRVPTDVPGVVDTALLVLEDWAQGATLDQAGIDRQRGIVLAEWRLRLGADERTLDKIRRVQLQGSRYVDRPPIGDPDIIQNARREQLTRFYRDWYRPDLMAVIVVGDIKRDEVISQIKAHFGPLVSPSPARPRPAFDVPDQPGTRYAVVTDQETTTTAVQISDLRPARNQGSVGGYRQIIRDQLFSSMLGNRLDEAAQSANPPFLRAAAGRRLFSTPRTRDEAIVQALVSNEGVTQGLDALVTELQRVTQFGFTATELRRAKQAMMNDYERSVTESPDRESSSRADEYTRNFLQSEALPTIWQELAFHRRFVPGITLLEMNTLGKDWFPDGNRVVIVSTPQVAGATPPDQAQLAAAVKAASARRLRPYVDSVAGQALMAAPPMRGTIVKTTTRPESGITEWTLSNGATVVLEPTTLKENQILFRAEAPGGTSLASDKDFNSARVADRIIGAGGAGRFSSLTLDKMLTGKVIAVSPFIDEINQGMAGGSTSQDLETMFQLLYLRFTEPRADRTAFAALTAQAKGVLANQLASPDVVFDRAITASLSQNHPRRQPETPATVDQWNLESALAFYKARFADASNFRFVFVGSFTLDAIRPFVETYIASLPSTRAHETWRDLGITLPAGVVEQTIKKGIAPKSQVAIVFSGPFQYDSAHRLALRTMTMLLQSQLLDTIRQELGGTYSITATPDADKSPRSQYIVRIDWTCDPARTTALVQRVFEEIERLKAMTFSPRQVALIRDSLLREFQQNSQENGFHLNEIARRYADGEAGGDVPIANMRDEIAALTGEAVQEAARTYLNTGNYLKLTLMPETN